MAFESMAPLMFLGLVVILLLGYPVAFSLAANGMLFAIIGIHFGFFDFSLLQALPERVYGIMSNATLLAIPFFTFMGLILERSGMAEDLLDTIGQLFGPLRGGLAFAAVFVGALLAAGREGADAARRADVPVEWIPERAALAGRLSGLVASGDVVLTLGAGDITGVGRELLARLAGRAA